MNLLHITLGFPPAFAWGGPVKVVYTHAQELIRRGHSVTVYCTNLLDKRHKIQPGTFERNLDGIRVVYFDAWRLPFWRGTLGPIWLPELPARLRRELPSFDLIHLHGYRNLMNVQVVAALRNAAMPLVVQPHGAMPVIVNTRLLKRLYDLLLGRWELRRAQAFIALSEAEKGQIQAHGIPPERIAVIPNGLPAQPPAPTSPPGAFRQRYRIPPQARLILFLGRLNRKKGVDLLIEAFAHLQDEDALLVVAGPDDGQLAEAQALVARYGLQRRVVFTGLLAAEEVEAAYRDADLFVLPCRTDTFPTAMLEACRAGLPMVITAGCEIAPLVQGRVAEVTPFDAEAFAAAVRRLLSDAELYQRYRQNAPQVLRDTFSVEAAVDRLEALYRRLIAAPPEEKP